MRQCTKSGQQRGAEDAEGDEESVVVDIEQTAEHVAARPDDHGPRERPDEVERGERRDRHRRDSGRRAGERAHERDETGDHDRARPEAPEVFVRSLQMTALVDSPVRALEKPRAHHPAQNVSGLAAGDGADRRRRDHEPQLGVRLARTADVAVGAGEDGERLAGSTSPRTSAVSRNMITPIPITP